MDNYVIIELDDGTALLAERQTRVIIGVNNKQTVVVCYKKVASFNSVQLATELLDAAKGG